MKAIGQRDQLSLVDPTSLNVETTLKYIAPVTVFVLTHSGTTARCTTRFRLPVWIVAESSQEVTCQRLQFSYGVYRVHEPDHPDDWNAYAREWLRNHEVVGNFVVLTEGGLVEAASDDTTTRRSPISAGRLARRNEREDASGLPYHMISG